VDPAGPSVDELEQLRERGYLARDGECPDPPRALSALSVLHTSTVNRFCMAVFVWVRRALDGQKRRFPARADEKTKKGGSFMCEASYCWRYRVCARTEQGC
jgi:hypothetical protein